MTSLKEPEPVLPEGGFLVLCAVIGAVLAALLVGYLLGAGGFN
jgi:hypothetical protein